MKPYASYTNTNISWIGEMPSHWKVTYLKFQTEFVNGAPFKPSEWSDVGLPIIRIENLNGGAKFNYFSGLIDKKYNVEPGDLLFAWSGNVGTSFGPYIWTRPGVHVLNQHIFRLQNYKLQKHYLYWVLRAVTSFIESKASGIIGLVHITKPELGRIPIPLVSATEQKAIADFLERRSGEIGEFIGKKRRMIELLKEQRTALIDRAVTRGVHRDAPKKPSGIEWLGAIPAHWEIKRAKYYFREVNESSTTGTEELLSVSHITGVTPRSEKDITMFMAESYEGYKTCQIGDLVINIMWAWMGALGVSEHSGIVSSAYGVYRQRNSLNFRSCYLGHLLRSKPYVAEFTCRSKGIRSSRLRMYSDDFFGVPIIKPPVSEQDQILTYLHERGASIQSAILKAEREIDLMREYLATLVSETVTGKIDVRGEQGEVDPERFCAAEGA